MTDAPPHPLAVRFAQFVAFLLEGIGGCGCRRQISAPLAGRLHVRLKKMVRQVAALLAHLAEFGADAPRRAYHRKQPPGAAAPQDPAEDPAQNRVQNPAKDSPQPGAARRRALPLSQAVRVPSRRAWLAGLSLNVNGAGARLQHMVYDPEVAALLAASPRLVALLRPLCRMLAVDLPAAVLPPRPPKAERPRRPRRRLWRPPSWRSDALFLLRMGTPLIET